MYQETVRLTRRILPEKIVIQPIKKRNHYAFQTYPSAYTPFRKSEPSALSTDNFQLNTNIYDNTLSVSQYHTTNPNVPGTIPGNYSTI